MLTPILLDHLGLDGRSESAQLASVQDVGLDAGVARLPHRHVDLDFPPRLPVAWRRRDVDLQFVGACLFCDTVGPPQVFLQTSQG